jgi:RHS repeat-associated protein
VDRQEFESCEIYDMKTNRFSETDIVVTWFCYDVSGIYGMNYDGTDYYFEKNILGSIVNIFNLRTGAYIGGYVYDAWGKLFARAYTDEADALDIVDANPFRYRGYYYDPKTKLYYLNSRYYDPEVGKFINADDPMNALSQMTQPNGRTIVWNWRK